MIDILNEMADLLERNIKTSLDRPYVVRRYNGTPKNVISPSISNTGNLRNQTKVLLEETPDGDGIQMVVDFGTAENYAWFVENGRRPGKGVPEGILQRWIAQRRLPQFRDNRGRFISNRDRLFLINRSIKQHGYAGRAFLQSAINQSLETIERRFGDAAEQFVLDYLEKSGLFGQYTGRQTPQDETTQFRVKLL